MDSDWSVALGVICVPTFVLGYLGFLGYRSFSPSETLAITFLWDLIPLVILGGVIGVALSRGLTVTVSIVAAAVLIVPALGEAAFGPWLSPGRPFGLASTFFLSGAIGFANVEYSARNQRTVGHSPDLRRLCWYATAGIAHLLFVYGAGAWLGLWEVRTVLDELLTITTPLGILFVGLVLALVSACVFLLGAVPALAFVRWRLAFPAVFVVLVLGETVRRTWVYAQWSPNQFGHTPAPLEAYVALCFVTLAGVSVVAALEYRLRIDRVWT